MKRMNKLGMIVARVLEVFHWVGTALMADAAICSLAAPAWVNRFVSYDAKECCGANLAVYGFEMNVPVVNGSADMTAFFLFGIGAVAILALMAMVFRNLHLIFKASESGTPFQKENIRRLKQIGIFSIAVPVVGVLMSIVIRLVMGVDAVETSVSQSGVFMGIIVLCLTQYFIHGAALEEDVDGLL